MGIGIVASGWESRGEGSRRTGDRREERGEQSRERGSGGSACGWMGGLGDMIEGWNRWTLI